MVVRPHDPDRHEADEVADVARPEGAERPDHRIRIGERIAGGDTDLEHQQRDGDGEDAVAECLQPLRTPATVRRASPLFVMGVERGSFLHRPRVSRLRYRSAVSSQIVNGPSLTSSTAISAPNRPVATLTPRPRSAPHESAVEPLGELGGAPAGEPRTPAAPRVGEQRELRDDQRLAAEVEQRAVRPAGVVAEDPQLGGLAGEVVGDRLGRRPGPTPSRIDQPGPIAPTTSPRPGPSAPVVRWRRALTAWPGGGMTRARR